MPGDTLARIVFNPFDGDVHVPRSWGFGQERRSDPPMSPGKHPLSGVNSRRLTNIQVATTFHPLLARKSLRFYPPVDGELYHGIVGCKALQVRAPIQTGSPALASV